MVRSGDRSMEKVENYYSFKVNFATIMQFIFKGDCNGTF